MYSPSHSTPPHPWPWAIALAVACIALRLVLLQGYGPMSYPDTGTYMQAAADLLSGDYSTGQARRPPGYPLLIALVGPSPAALVYAQMALGVATSLLLFAITLRLTQRPGLAFGIGLAHSLNLQQLFQEATLLTETLSAFATIATLALFVFVLRPLKHGRSGKALVAALAALGVLAAFALLVRPQFVFLVGLLPALVLLAVSGWRWPSARSAGLAFAVAAPAVAVVLAWCALVNVKVGHFTLSTQSGFGMVNHVIDYIELAPDRYAPVREVLLKTREARVAEAGHSRNTIWYAWPEIQRVTGWSLPEASRQLQRMCQEMFIAYPGRYAVSVASAWVDFWTVPIFWEPEKIQPPVMAGVLDGIWWVEHKLLRLANLAFVLLVGAAALLPQVRRALRWDLAMTAMAATILLSSLIQALADQGASSRYALPTQSVAVLMLFVALARWRGVLQPTIGQAGSLRRLDTHRSA